VWIDSADILELICSALNLELPGASFIWVWRGSYHGPNGAVWENGPTISFLFSFEPINFPCRAFLTELAVSKREMTRRRS